MGEIIIFLGCASSFLGIEMVMTPLALVADTFQHQLPEAMRRPYDIGGLPEIWVRFRPTVYSRWLATEYRYRITCCSPIDRATESSTNSARPPRRAKSSTPASNPSSTTRKLRIVGGYGLGGK